MHVCVWGGGVAWREAVGNLLCHCTIAAAVHAHQFDVKAICAEVAALSSPPCACPCYHPPPRLRPCLVVRMRKGLARLCQRHWRLISLPVACLYPINLLHPPPPTPPPPPPTRTPQAMFGGEDALPELRSLSKGEAHYDSFGRHFPVARLTSKTSDVQQVRKQGKEGGGSVVTSKERGVDCLGAMLLSEEGFFTTRRGSPARRQTCSR